MDLLAIRIQFLRPLSSRIFYTMEMDLNAFFVEVFDLIKNIDHSTVIRRIWDIKGNDMYVLILQKANKFELIFLLLFPNKALMMQS